ncbi:VOC family protein [Alkalihalobacillus sp. 1P02AB]|uniref:VOC family protein n=1 Tax=Alkalihalobacillus sp. 1P02AB TaxID=3132260 RepID=UPI0039A5F7F3
MTSISLKLNFNTAAEDAAYFYTKIFKNSAIVQVTRFPEERKDCIKCGIDPAQAGSVMNVDFTIGSTSVTALNGRTGPEYEFNKSISLSAQCENQEEFYEIYQQLSTSGDIVVPLSKDELSEPFAWVKDKFGIYWKLIISVDTQQQVVPHLFFSNDQQLKEALAFYQSLFQEVQSALHSIKTYHQNENDEVFFHLKNQQFIGAYTNETLPPFTEGISFIIVCRTQKEVDNFWKALSKEGKGLYREASAWLEDKYGVWWQIISLDLATMMENENGLEKAIEEMGSNLLINVEKMQNNND